MNARWPSESQRALGVEAWRLPTATFALVLLVLVASGLLFAARERTLRGEIDRLREEARIAALRQHELESQIARQHETLRTTEGALAALQLQMGAVELQLDGVDYLSREVRREMGLSATAGTWEGVSAESPRGGGYFPTDPDGQRLGLAQLRLVNGMQELQGLLESARAMKLPAGAEDAPPPVPRPPANWPARGPVTSDFGWRWFRGLPNFHMGIDIALPYATPVAATGDGIVLGSGWQPGYGWSVFVQHADGYHTLFAHLAEVAARVGDTVRTGTLLGVSGSSGTSTGPHLHYEIWKDGRPLDPRPFMDGAASR